MIVHAWGGLFELSLVLSGRLLIVVLFFMRLFGNAEKILYALNLIIFSIWILQLINLILLIYFSITAYYFVTKTDPIFPFYPQLHILLLKLNNPISQLMHIIDILILKHFPIMPQSLYFIPQYLRNLIQSLFPLFSIITTIY